SPLPHVAVLFDAPGNRLSESVHELLFGEIRIEHQLRLVLVHRVEQREEDVVRPLATLFHLVDLFQEEAWTESLFFGLGELVKYQLGTLNALVVPTGLNLGKVFRQDDMPAIARIELKRAASAGELHLSGLERVDQVLPDRRLVEQPGGGRLAIPGWGEERPSLIPLLVLHNLLVEPRLFLQREPGLRAGLYVLVNTPEFLRDFVDR